MHRRLMKSPPLYEIFSARNAIQVTFVVALLVDPFYCNSCTVHLELARMYGLYFVASEALDYFQSNIWLVFFLGLTAFIIGLEGSFHVCLLPESVLPTNPGLIPLYFPFPFSLQSFGKRLSIPNY